MRPRTAPADLSSAGPLDLDAEISAPDRLRAVLRASAGSTLAVVGPNGAGKSTLLAALAGTTPVAGESRVRVGEEDWSRLPPHLRRAALVFQDHRLFPHLDVAANVGFGPRSRGADRRTARRAAQRWLDAFELTPLSGRRPGTLSGGQAQRVALARALATAPRLLLLDEPFAALDVAAATSIRARLAEHLRDRARITLLVTHDALDVHALAERVLVIEDGRVVQDATPAEVAESPSTAHAARLLGLNVLAGSAAGTEVALDGGGVLVSTDPHHGPALATFAPSAVTITAEEPTGSARNRWPVRVLRLFEHDGVVRAHLSGSGGAANLLADLTPGSARSLALQGGSTVWASVKATEVRVFPAVGEATSR